MLMRRNAEKKWQPEKANGDYNRKKNLQSHVGTQNFQELEAGEEPNFLKLK